MIRKLLCVNAQGRPTCEQILNSELVQKNLIKLDLIGMVPYALLRDKSYGQPPGADGGQPGNGNSGADGEGRANAFDRKQILMNTI